MSNKDKYPATLAGIEVMISDRGVSDTVEWALVKHEYPNRDGALVENMGQRGTPHHFTCFFYNDDFDLHQDLYDAISKQSSPIEFIHPEHGVLRGYVERMHRRFDDRLRLAEIDILFVESIIEPEQIAEPSIGGVCEEAFQLGQTEAMTQCVADVTEVLGTEGSALMDRALVAGQDILSQFQDLTGKARAFVAQVDAGVRTLEGTLSAVTQPANSIIATIDYTTNLPGRVIGAIAETVERYAEAFSDLRTAPARFASSMKNALGQLEQSFLDFRTTAPAGSVRAIAENAAAAIMAKHVQLAAAQRLALEAAYAFKADQLNRQAGKRIENQPSFDVLGNFLGAAAVDPIMNVTDIEAVLAEVMASAQTGVDNARTMQSIKTAVDGLVAHARRIKLEIARIYSVDIENTMPLHLICLKYGLPYNAADRILAINPQIKNPSFVSGTIKLYAA